MSWWIVVILFIASQVQPTILHSNPILKCPEIQQAIDKIWNETAAKQDSTEYCFTVESDNINFYSGTPYRCVLYVDNKSVATFHTHPDDTSVEPSKEDREDAVKTGLPFYVVSEHQIWVALPNGKLEQVSFR